MDEDLYAILEIDARASEKEIRRAFFRLAKLYHPDHQGAHDEQATSRFIAIQRAYRVLSSPKERALYDAERRGEAPEKERLTSGGGAASVGTAARPAVKRAVKKGPGPSADDIRDARRAFAMAQELLEMGNSGKALDVLKAVNRVIPDVPEYMSALGFAMALERKNLHSARDLCRRAIEAEPYRADFHAHLGMVYHKAGLCKLARQSFEEALRWDPQHELALGHLGGSEERPSGLKGLLQSVFAGRGRSRGPS